MLEAYKAVEAMADTPLIAMIDDDCWWEPEHLEILAKLMEDTGSDFVWASTTMEREGTGEVVDVRDSSIPAYGYIDTNEILYRKSCVERWGGFLLEDCNQGALPKIRGIDGRRIERWVANGAIYAHSHEPTVHYTWRPEPEF